MLFSYWEHIRKREEVKSEEVNDLLQKGTGDETLD